MAVRAARPHLGGAFGAKLLVYAALLACRVRVTVKVATITGKLGSYFGTRRWDKMFDGQITFGLWCVVAAATTAAMKYWRSKSRSTFAPSFTKRCTRST